MGEPAILPFDWADPFDLDSQLTDEEKLVRDTAEGYAQEKLQPRVTAAYMDENFDRGILSGVPPELFQSLPYVMTVVVLVLVSSAGARRRLGAPAALGTPYVREER